MFFDRWHHGYRGLWQLAAIKAVETTAIGVLFAFDGKGTTSATAYDPVKLMARSAGMPGGREMDAWGVVFVTLGVVCFAALTPLGGLLRWSKAFLASAVLWVTFASAFLAFAVAHHGLGTVGAVLWGGGALAQLVIVVAAADYHAHPRLQAR